MTIYGPDISSYQDCAKPRRVLRARHFALLAWLAAHLTGGIL